MLAADRYGELNSLKNLRMICISTPFVEPELAKTATLRPDSLLVAAQLLLRRVGLIVKDCQSNSFTEDWESAFPGAEVPPDVAANAPPSVTIAVSGFKASEVWSYTIEVSLCELAKVFRNDKLHMVRSWRSVVFGTVGSSKVEQLRASIEGVVDEFANRWLEDNPPRLALAPTAKRIE